MAVKTRAAAPSSTLLRLRDALDGHATWEITSDEVRDVLDVDVERINNGELPTWPVERMRPRRNSIASRTHVSVPRETAK